MKKNVKNRKRTIEKQNARIAAKVQKIAAKVTPEKGLSEIEMQEARLMANDLILERAKLDENESSEKKGFRLTPKQVVAAEAKERTEERRSTASAYSCIFCIES